MSCSTLDLGVVETQTRPADAVLEDRVERQRGRVAAPQTGLHEQHDQVADGGVAEPSQVGVGLELVHHELGDEEAAGGRQAG